MCLLAIYVKQLFTKQHVQSASCSVQVEYETP